MVETKRPALDHRCRAKAAQNGRGPRQSPRRQYDAYQVTQIRANSFQASVTQMQWSGTDRLAALFQSYRVTSKEQRLSFWTLPVVNFRFSHIDPYTPDVFYALFTSLALKTTLFRKLPTPRCSRIIGNVVAIGDGEHKWKVGDRVGGPWHGGKFQRLIFPNFN